MPGVGPKTASRLAHYLLGLPVEEARRLADAIVEVKEKVRPCPVCFNYTDEVPCALCQDPERDRTTLCVVAEPRDLVATERTGEYRGLYHVLGGLISPMDGVGPEDLRIDALMVRLERDPIREVILALNPVVEGDATAMYLAEQLKPRGVKVSRLALGLPVGGDLDYADEVTIARALAGRTAL